MFDPNKYKTEMSNARKPSLHKNNLGNTKRNKITNGSVGKLDTRYRIPPKLIESLFEDI